MRHRGRIPRPACQSATKGTVVIATVPPSVPAPSSTFSPVVSANPADGSCSAAKATIVAMTTRLLKSGAIDVAKNRWSAWSSALATAPAA